MDNLMHIVVIKETGEITDFYAAGISVPEYDPDHMAEIIPVLQEDLIDETIIRGQYYNYETGKVEDTVLSLNSKFENALKQTDWLVIRHRDQKDQGIQTSLSDEDYQDLLNYRQTMREGIQ